MSYINLLEQINQQVVVRGFVHSIRDHGSLVFIDLRNQTDILQCVVDPKKFPQAFATSQQIGNEYVLEIKGKILKRNPQTINPNLSTGSIELEVSEIQIVSTAKPLPFDLHASADKLASEDIRLKYRYLDLRRPKLQTILTKKHKFLLDIRNWFSAQGFIEVQTPILANSSPEGARDYLVPSRLHPGKFYALPQAPQQFKQLLMVGGFNKYFQIAPCFRDEDPRADRHPGDFYQLDCEIAWADQERIYQFCWQTIQEVFASHSQKKLSKDFVKIRYDDAMKWFGSDKPDLRIRQNTHKAISEISNDGYQNQNWIIAHLGWLDAKGLFQESTFEVFAKLANSEKALLQALVVKKGTENLSRGDLDRIQELAKNSGLPGLAYIQFENYLDESGEILKADKTDNLSSFSQQKILAKSPILKFFGSEEQQQIKLQQMMQVLNLDKGDLVLFVGHQDQKLVYKIQNQVRQYLAKRLNLVTEDLLQFVWIYDFPFFEETEDGQLDFAHNPFGIFQNWSGKSHLETLLEAEAKNRLLDLRAIQYDIALNGYEVLSGGKRNHMPDVLLKAFNLVGYSKEEVQRKFGHMLEAYTYGAPPHAGFAWGLDRLFMILIDEENIREVIAFPKNGSGVDLMMNSPSQVQDKQLRELRIKTY